MPVRSLVVLFSAGCLNSGNDSMLPCAMFTGFRLWAMTFPTSSACVAIAANDEPISANTFAASVFRLPKIYPIENPRSSKLFRISVHFAIAFPANTDAAELALLIGSTMP